MVVVPPKDFFIYATRDKLWIVLGAQIWELKNYYPTSVDVTVNNNLFENFLIDDSVVHMAGNREISFSLNGKSADFSFLERKDVDLSDFYEMEEMKKLSKIIQKKFRKLNAGE